VKHRLRSINTSGCATLERDVSLVDQPAEKVLSVVAAMQDIFGAVEVHHTSDSTKETATFNASDAIVICRGTWRIIALDLSSE